MNNHKDFSKLFLASFVSQSGSHLLTLAIAAFVFMSSGSVLKSGLVFVVSYLPSILVSARVGSFIDRNISKALLIGNDFISILLSIICGLVLFHKLPIALLCGVLAVRSIFTFVGRTSSLKWLKMTTSDEAQAGRMKLMFLSFFLSTALAGVIAGAILTKHTIWMVVLIDVISYCGSMAIFSRLKKIEITEPVKVSFPQNSESISETLATILRDQSLRRSFLYVVVSQAVFQAAYSVLVSYLPIQRYSLGIGGSGTYQLAASAGITLGFLLVWMLPTVFREKSSSLSIRAFTLFLIGIAALGLSITTSSFAQSLIGFCFFNIAYECIWLHHSSEFFKASPKASAAQLQFMLSASASFVMSCVVLVYSVAIENLGLVTGIASSLTALLGAVVLISVSINRAALSRSSEQVAV